jgi:hypothetical protein
MAFKSVKKSSEFKNYTFLLSVILFSIWYSWRIDPREFFQNQVFLYDTLHFSKLAASWQTLSFEYTTGIPAPFGARIGFPFLSGMASEKLGLTLSLSAYLIEVIVIVFVAFILFREMKICDISSISVLTILCYFLFSWNYPLRMAGSWPASGNSIATLAVLMAYFAVVLAHRKGKKSAFAVFAVSISGILLREVFLLTLIVFCVIELVIKKLIDYVRCSRKGLRPEVGRGIIKSIFLKAIIPSGLVFAYLQSLSNVKPSFFEYVSGYTSLFWTHLHLGNFLYSALSAYGFAILVVCTMIFNESARKRFAETISKIHHFRIIFNFCLSGIIISVVGGGDTERIMTWFFPFVAIITALALDSLFKTSRVSRGKLAGLFLIFLLGSRMLVPNLPHMFLVQNSTYCSTAGVKTNYSPSVFYGPSFMEAFRLPVKEVPKEDLPRNAKDFIRGSDVWQIKGGGSPMVAAGKYECENGVKGPYFNNYRYELNNVPVPFGFQHNQFEVYSSWSWWADWRAQLIYILQWIMAVIILAFPSRVGRRNKEITLDH